MSLFGDILRIGGNAILGPVEGLLGKNIISDKATTGFGSAVIKATTTITNSVGGLAGGIVSKIPGLGAGLQVAQQLAQLIPPPPADVQANKAVQEAYAQAQQAQTQEAIDAYYRQVNALSQTPLPVPKKDNSLLYWIIGGVTAVCAIIAGIVIWLNPKKKKRK